jgi:hypothetical protein
VPGPGPGPGPAFVVSSETALYMTNL